MLLEGFTRSEIATSGARIHTVTGGSGPPLLLLHGMPFTHLSWHAVAPLLARDFTVVCTDLRGYGDSGKPASAPDHTPYSFRAMAQDQVEVMAALGFERFAAAGHDRGARVLHRMCLDHPSAVTRAAFLDILPQHHLLTQVTRAWASFSWHWFFLIQPEDFPERMIAAAPELYVRRQLAKTEAGLGFFHPAALAEYIRCMKDPAVIHGMCEDYRATFTVDLAQDSEDFAAGRKVACPALLLWGATGGVGRNHRPMEVWPEYCADLRRGVALPGGHHIAEECPAEVAAELHAFFSAARCLDSEETLR